MASASPTTRRGVYHIATLDAGAVGYTNIRVRMTWFLEPFMSSKHTSRRDQFAQHAAGAAAMTETQRKRASIFEKCGAGPDHTVTAGSQLRRGVSGSDPRRVIIIEMRVVDISSPLVNQANGVRADRSRIWQATSTVLRAASQKGDKNGTEEAAFCLVVQQMTKGFHVLFITPHECSM